MIDRILNVMKKWIFLIIIGFICLDCTHKDFKMVDRKNDKNHSMSLNSLPKINDKLDSSIRITSKHSWLVNSSQCYPSTEILVDNISYEIAWEGNGTVFYISTSDSKFETEEGVKINMTLSDILKKTESEVNQMPGWGYYIKLKSGWNAGFSVDETCTGRELVSNDSVKWIFKWK